MITHLALYSGWPNAISAVAEAFSDYSRERGNGQTGWWCIRLDALSGRQHLAMHPTVKPVAYLLAGLEISLEGHLIEVAEVGLIPRYVSALSGLDNRFGIDTSGSRPGSTSLPIDRSAAGD